MAAKRRDPTAAARRQIKGKLQKILKGKLEFISIKNMQSWYGRYDDAAISRLESAWKEYWSGHDWDPGRAPKLFAVGPISTLNGYAVCRNDKKNNWLR